MRRALAKPHLRVVAVDDGAFRRSDATAPLVAVAWSGPDLIESIALGRVTVDGTDATSRVAALIRSLPQFEGVKAVLLDGIVVGGFNVIDLDDLSDRLGRPVVTVTRGRPEFRTIRSALAKYFPKDHAERYRRLRRHRLEPYGPELPSILLAAVGCDRAEALAVLRRCVQRGQWPEPLRIAHLVGHALGTSRRRPTRTAATSRGRPNP